MASMAQQFTGLRCAPLSSSRLSTPFSPRHLQNKARSLPVHAAVISSPIPSPQTKERFKLKEVFEDAYERCRNAPVEGISFTLEDFHAALEKYDFDSEMGTKVLCSLSFSCNFVGFLGNYSGGLEWFVDSMLGWEKKLQLLVGILYFCEFSCQFPWKGYYELELFVSSMV